MQNPARTIEQQGKINTNQTPVPVGQNMLIKPILAALLWAVAFPTLADPSDTFCNTIQSQINVLADFTDTTCLPSKGGRTGTVSFLIISDKPIFSSEKRKKVWLLVSCSAAGSQLNKERSLAADELWFSDIENTRQRVAYTVPAALC